MKSQRTIFKMFFLNPFLGTTKNLIPPEDSYSTTLFPVTNLKGQYSYHKEFGGITQKIKEIFSKCFFPGSSKNLIALGDSYKASPSTTVFSVTKDKGQDSYCKEFGKITRKIRELFSKCFLKFFPQ